jgi:hypothetical protein
MKIPKNKFLNNLFDKFKEYIEAVVKEETKGYLSILKAELAVLNKKKDDYNKLIKEESDNVKKEVARAKRLSDPKYIHYEAFFLKEDSDMFILEEKNLLVLKKEYQKDRGRFSLFVEVYVDGARQVYCPYEELDYTLGKDKDNCLIIEFFDPINKGAFIEIKAYKEI